MFFTSNKKEQWKGTRIVSWTLIKLLINVVFLSINFNGNVVLTVLFLHLKFS